MPSCLSNVEVTRTIVENYYFICFEILVVVPTYNVDLIWAMNLNFCKMHLLGQSATNV